MSLSDYSSHLGIVVQVLFNMGAGTSHHEAQERAGEIRGKAFLPLPQYQ